MDSPDSAYHELYAYTMGRGTDFILQHVVDAYAAQTATSATKPMKIVFALVGLYLHVEKQFSGRRVQRVHMLMGRRKREWPRIPLPQGRGELSVADVLAVAEGAERDLAIDAWCRSVWNAYADSRSIIVTLLDEETLGY
jgi:hypothetical protein